MKNPTILHCETHGDAGGKPLVLLHGFMGNTREWDTIVAHLKPHLRCLVIDLPGHGKSAHVPEDTFSFAGTADAIAQAMEAAHVIPSPILGYSLGGRIALYLAVHCAHLCSALIIESASAGIATEKARAERLSGDKKTARALERGSFEQFLRTWYSQPVFASIAEVPQTLEAVIAQRRDNEPTQLAKALRTLSVGAQPSLWASLPSVKVPVLVITGKRDEKYVAVSNKLAGRLPSASLFIDPDAGHNVHLENPLGFAACIKDFLLKE